MEARSFSPLARSYGIQGPEKRLRTKRQSNSVDGHKVDFENGDAHSESDSVDSEDPMSPDEFHRRFREGADQVYAKILERRAKSIRLSNIGPNRVYKIPYRPGNPCASGPCLTLSLSSKNYQAIDSSGRDAWLCDEILCGYLYYLQYKWQHVMGFMFMFEIDPYPRTLLESLKVFLSDRSRAIYLAPVHLNGNHWALYVLDKASRDAYFLDSLGGSRLGLRDTPYRDKMASLLRDVDSESKWHVYSIACAQQENSYDSGAYVCYFMDALARLTVGLNYVISNAAEIKISANMKRFRKTIQIVIDQYLVPEPK